VSAIVNCPQCGTPLKNIPRTLRSTCPQCVSCETYPKVTWEMKHHAKEAEHAAQRQVIPIATPLKCIGERGVVWRWLSDRPGIFTHCQKKDPGAVLVKTPIGALMYVSRSLAIEAELRSVMGVVDAERFEKLCQACLDRNFDQQQIIVGEWSLHNKGEVQ